MPPNKDFAANKTRGRSVSSHGMTIQAHVYHPATNLLPPSPPLSPTGVAAGYTASIKSNNALSWSRQNSQNGGKYS